MDHWLTNSTTVQPNRTTVVPETVFQFASGSNDPHILFWPSILFDLTAQLTLQAWAVPSEQDIHNQTTTTEESSLQSMYGSPSRLTASNCTVYTIRWQEPSTKRLNAEWFFLVKILTRWDHSALPITCPTFISHFAMWLKRSVITEQPQFKPYHTFYLGCFQREGAKRF